MENKANTKNTNSNKIGIKEAIGYMLGDAGNLFVLTYVSSFLKVFYTDVLKIVPAKVARLFLFTRMWDAVNDPMWGAIVARRRPDKNGKYRSFLKWVAIPLALSELICFLNVRTITKNDMLIMMFAYVTYIAFGMLYTGMNVPFGSLASVITDDPDGRTLLSTFRSIGGGIGGAAPLLVAPFVIYTKVDDGNGGTYNVANDRGMMMFAIAMAACSVVFYLSCYKTTTERIATDANPKIDFKSTYLSMLKSRPFMVLATTGVLISGELQFASLNQYLYKNYFCNTNLSVLGSIAQYLPMAIMIPLIPKLSKKYGKKEICGFGSFFAALAAVLIFLIKPAPNQPYIFIGLLFVIGFGYSFVSITNWAVVADVIDYQEYKTGVKSESAIYAVYTFCRKLGQTIADFGGLTLLGKIGYDATIMANAGYVEGVSEGILKVCTLIPAVIYSLIFILYKFAYPLTKDKLVPVYDYVRSHNKTIGEEELVTK